MRTPPGCSFAQWSSPSRKEIYWKCSESFIRQEWCENLKKMKGMKNIWQAELGNRLTATMTKSFLILKMLEADQYSAPSVCWMNQADLPFIDGNWTEQGNTRYKLEQHGCRLSGMTASQVCYLCPLCVSLWISPSKSGGVHVWEEQSELFSCSL